ncbi:helix-turn-helix domain-containing protein [Cystobacter fuscus]|nr:helix-turn-helix domain-containing protein [Cystobacter fuscus]
METGWWTLPRHALVPRRLDGTPGVAQKKARYPLTTPPLPIARFSTEALPEAERFGAWHDAMSALYEVSSSTDAARGRFSARATCIQLGPMILGTMHADALAYERSPARIRSDSLDHFILGLADEEVLIQDLGQPLSLPMGPLSGACIVLPRSMMAQVLPATETLHGARLTGGMARLLLEHTQSLIRAAPALTASQAPHLARATQQVIAACLMPTRATLDGVRPHLQATALVRARRFIERNLTEPDLSSARISAAVGVSRSVLYELFAPFQGVARYILGRRLERIHSALADSGEHRRIADVASEFGLMNEAHFSRVFRKRFGYAPREIRGTGLGRPVQPHARGAGAETRSQRLEFPMWVEQLRE